MKKIALICLIFQIQSCLCQNNHGTKKNIILNVIQNKDSTDKIDLKSNQVTMYFMSKFEDSLSIYLDNKLIKKDYYSTNFSTSFTNKILEFDLKKYKKKKHTIKIICHNKIKNICTFNIIEGYKIIEVYLINENWIINFSNNLIIFE